MYGAQTIQMNDGFTNEFENDVEMYGAQTISFGRAVMNSV